MTAQEQERFRGGNGLAYNILLWKTPENKNEPP
jgi:hypothetical protein